MHLKTCISAVEIILNCVFLHMFTRLMIGSPKCCNISVLMQPFENFSIIEYEAYPGISEHCLNIRFVC